MSPDVDGNRAPKKKCSTACFTVYLFISPDLGEYQDTDTICLHQIRMGGYGRTLHDMTLDT
jgi:hypothetical protein